MSALCLSPTPLTFQTEHRLHWRNEEFRRSSASQQESCYGSTIVTFQADLFITGRSERTLRAFFSTCDDDDTLCRPPPRSTWDVSL